MKKEKSTFVMSWMKKGKKAAAAPREKKKKMIADKITKSILSIAISCTLVVGVFGVACIYIMRSQSEQMYTQNVKPLTPLYTTQADFQSIRSYLKTMALVASTGTTNGIDYSGAIESLRADMIRQLGSYSKGLSTSAEKANYAEISSNVGEFKDAVEQIEDEIKLKDMITVMNLFTKYDTISSNLNTEISMAYTTSVNQAKQRNDMATTIFYISILTVLALTVAAILISIKLSRFIAKGISSPIRRMVKAAEEIAEGNLGVNLDVYSQDETGTLAHAFRKIIKSLNLMKTDVEMLINEALAGNLDERADVSQHSGDYKAIIEGVNKMFDTVKEPLDVASGFIDRLADGVRQEPVENTYNGYYGVLIDNLNNVRNSIEVLEKEAGKLAKAGLNGELDVRGDETVLKGVYAQIIHGVNQTFDAIKEPLDVASFFIAELAAGTADEPIQNVYKGYYAKLVDNINSVLGSLLTLLKESDMLAKAGKRGDLTVRSDISKVPGHYADVVGGMNGILDAVSAPLEEAGHILKRISDDNDFTEKMTGNYQGAFGELSQSINNVLESMAEVEQVFTSVSIGDMKWLEPLRQKGKLSENDKLTPAAVTMMLSLQDLVGEANRLASAAISGELNQRGDADKFQGEYRQVIDGFNGMFKAVAKPLQEARQVLQELANGNLDVDMTGEYLGEYDQIKQAIQQVITSFNSVLSELNTAASQVASGSKQVSEASQSLSQGATEQASSVEELTSSIAEVAAQTKQNADDATQASVLSATAQEQAAQGNAKMVEMLNSMHDINESSNSISKIIKVIDDIAFQTNILALNAAVEAARAGQYGKGFAVVAEEVRNLAAKSAEAANDTTTLIEGSIAKVESGTKTANATAEMLGKISDSVNKASNLVKNIAAASNDQATAISQIDRGISQVSMVVQTTSATAEESAASSEELSGQAEALMHMVGQFTLKSASRQKNR